MMRKILLMLGLIVAGLMPMSATTVGLSFPDTTFLRGTTVYIPVRIDSSLTGLQVTAYELQITYDATIFHLDSVVSGGTLTQSWGAPVVHGAGGTINIAGASTTALSGKGVLVYLKMTMPLTSNGGYSNFQFMNALFNEGNPATVTRNGNIYISNPPSITIYPDNAIVTVRDQYQFQAYGGTPPYTWKTTDTTIAIIDGNGWFTARHTGLCRVVASDISGVRDTSGLVEVRAFKLSVRDTTYIQGQTFLLPIYISDLTGVDITSGSFSLTFDANILTALGIEGVGTVFASLGDPTVHIQPGAVTIGFATATRLNVIGTQPLIYIRCKVTETLTYSSVLQFSNVLFNESLAGVTRDGYFYPIVLGTLTISFPEKTLVKGDSMLCSASGEITQPLTWSVSDTSLGSISSSGMLHAKKGGVIRVHVVDGIGAKGQSEEIKFYDAKVALPSMNATRGDTIEIPVTLVGAVSDIYSTQFSVSFDTTYCTPIGVTTLGTIIGSSGWFVTGFSPSNGVFSIAAAGSSPISSSGVLIYIRVIISESTPQGDYPLTMGNILCNEGKPILLPVNGQLHVASSVSANIYIKKNWNVVSLPLRLTDYRKSVLFPHAVGSVFGYNNGYTQKDTLAFGTAYWVKYAAAETISVTGVPSMIETLAVADKWNMIGSISGPVEVSSIEAIGTTVTSLFFDFGMTTGYVGTTTLQPGVGYWVRVNGAGKLVLRSEVLTKKSKPQIK